MTEQHTTEETTTGSKKFSYIAYSVRDRGEGKKSKFTEIGVAFAHKDGKGHDILFDVIPLGGKITLRVQETQEAKK
jgi:hypothetical protein